MLEDDILVGISAQMADRDYCDDVLVRPGGLDETGRWRVSAAEDDGTRQLEPRGSQAHVAALAAGAVSERNSSGYSKESNDARSVPTRHRRTCTGARLNPPQQVRHARTAKAAGNRQLDGGTARVGPPRVVVFVTTRILEMSRWLNVFGEYAAVRGYRIVTVTADPLAAMIEVVAGRADRILTGSDHEMRPLVETVTGQAVDIPASQRRPRRMR